MILVSIFQVIILISLAYINCFSLQENHVMLNNNNYNSKATPSAAATMLNGNIGSTASSSSQVVEDLYAKVWHLNIS